MGELLARCVLPQGIPASNLHAVLARGVHDLVLDLRARFLRRSQGPAQVIRTETVLVPRTWWDHWKVDHPRLARLFRPPDTRTILVSTYLEERVAICPHLAIGEGVREMAFLHDTLDNPYPSVQERHLRHLLHPVLGDDWKVAVLEWVRLELGYARRRR